MTGLPAATIGMADRGLLAVGMAADLVAFDPATVIDHATFEEPMLPSDGIRFVVVNGRVALRDGVATGEHAGMALFRSAHMPTRPMQVGEKRRFSRRERIGPARLTLDLVQDAKATRASGTFSFVDPSAKIAIDMKELGVLQTAPGWASFTGRAALRPSDEERSMTVTIDGTTLVIDAGAAFSVTRDLRR
jgi:N-acyl-D-amino-acid deacylase